MNCSYLYLTQVATYRTPTIEIVANVAKSAFAFRGAVSNRLDCR
jgi:hypothetical protein